MNHKYRRPTFYTVQEVASTMRISDETVYRMIWDGKIEACKVGRQWRCSSETFNKMKTNHKKK